METPATAAMDNRDSVYARKPARFAARLMLCGDELHWTSCWSGSNQAALCGHGNVGAARVLTEI